MAELPIMSVSGIRGIFGKTIDPLFVSRIAYIQTRLAGGGKILVGRDTRASGLVMAEAIFRGIRAAGGTPLDLGIAPTPTICVSVEALNASAGIIITASHNPGQYNGYKMVHSSGRLYRAKECQTVYDAFHRGEYLSSDDFNKFSGIAEKSIDGASIHIQKILNRIDVKLIQSAELKIAIDSINGAAGAVFPQLLKELNVEWVGVHNKLDGDFVHNPEPRPEHLQDLANLLKKTPRLWGGFVFDPDADRLATMGETGQEISEEFTLVFALDNLLGRKKSAVATNLSTSMLIDDVAKKYGVDVIRSKIGEANVVEDMEKHGCIYGGEGNGGVIFPEISSCRDGLGGLALILELMASRKKRLSELASEWPKYSIVKEKLSCEGTDPLVVLKKVDEKFPSEQKNRLDGLKIIRDYGWVHLRASNTEPIIRCYAEARSNQQAVELAEMVLRAARDTR
ncbi:MAG TPA: phosphoglucosamine mutase [Chitinispirillaceae bacterium]|nr:phosphoglucosamine mutase [Chitinispirillaceae bacterium]